MPFSAKWAALDGALDPGGNARHPAAMRTFLALPVPDVVADALADAQEGLPAGRPVPWENFHVTVAFLGDVPDGPLELLHDLLIGRRPVAPRIAVTGIGPLEGAEPGLLVAHVAPSPELVALQAGAVGHARRAGIALGRRRFRPHVTVARGAAAHPGMGAWLAQRAQTPIPDWTASALELWSSTLHSDGARYERLSAYPLRPVPSP